MNGVHFNPSVQSDIKEIRVHTVFKNTAVIYLRLVTFTCLEFDLALEITVSGT